MINNNMSMITVLLATLIFGGNMLYLFLKRRKKVELMPVEAGPTSCTTEDFLKPVQVQIGTMPMDPSLQYFYVRNECMIPRHIYPGDVIGVQMLDDNFTLADIKKGDILLIFIDDDKFRGHKIRVMDDVEDNAFHTSYFIANRPNKSSKPHSFSTIRGVVRETNHLNYNI